MGPSVKFVLAIIDSISKKKWGFIFFRKIGHEGGGFRGLRVCGRKKYRSSFLNISLSERGFFQCQTQGCSFSLMQSMKCFLVLERARIFTAISRNTLFCLDCHSFQFCQHETLLIWVYQNLPLTLQHLYQLFYFQ